jgi:tryptophan-rich sensory protein
MGGIFMRKNWKKLLLLIAVPLAVGGLAALLSGGMGEAYQGYAKPPLSPPGWVFAVVWPILYALMGYASFLVAESEGNKTRAFVLYGLQLLANFLWPILFFRFELVGSALALLAVLWVLVLLTLREFSEHSVRAGDLLIPYILWLSFALYLNFGVYVLN